MTHPLDSFPDPSDDEIAALGRLLARADAWDDVPRSIEDDVVAAISAEAGQQPAHSSAPVEPTSLDERRARRSWSPGRALGAAAVAALVVAGIAAITRLGTDDTTTFALEPTDAAPGASAQVEVEATPAGLKIVLDANGLAGAADGFMYEAWIGDGEIAISAGTFHFRGGDDPIELWAGVADPAFNRLWITLEPIDDDLSPSGDTRLRGEFSLDD